MEHKAERIFEMTRSGLNRIQQALSIFDADLKLVVANRRFQEMFALPNHVVRPGASFDESIRFLAERGDYGPIEDVEEFVAERVAQALTFKPHYVERTRADGMTISVEGSPLRQGGWVAVYTDITDIKAQEALLRSHSDELSEELLNRSEELARINRELAAANAALEEAQNELVESEARTRMTTEMIPAHVAHVDLEKRYTYSNRKLSTLLPHAPSDIIGMKMEAALGKEAFSHVGPYLEEALNGGVNVFEFDFDNATRRIRCAFTPDIRDGGEIAGVYVLSMDVTQETQARVALSQSRKRELAVQLTSGLAHDFSNLLTIILGLQGQLERRDDLPEDVQTIVSTTKDAARRGGSLLDRLSDISGSRGINPQPVTIDEVFENLQGLGRAAVPETVLLELINEGVHGRLMLDQGYTQDALLNLILNASDAMAGVGDISITARIVSGIWLHFEVRDNGSGFSHDALEHAIDPFFTTKPHGSGSGLGLTMAYDFTKLCGGRVTLRNRPERGATVIIAVPYVEVPLTTTPGLVLLVEDTEAIRNDIREMLRDMGHAVLEANTGEEALSLAQLPGVTHVLSDVMLAGDMTGLDMARHIDTNVPIYMITGLPGDDPIRREVAASYPVLSKPFSAEQLRAFLGASA